MSTPAVPQIPPANALEIRDLRKVYKASGRSRAKEALKGVNLDIPRGSIFGLLGPNGAGKSTLINILAGLVIKTSGDARIWGYDVERQARAARCCIGVVPQELNLDAFFTPKELLDVQAGLYGVPKAERRTDALLAAVELTDKADAYARTLSGGMRRRLMVAKAMVHSPPVLVLDEPTAGVDVELRRTLWQHVRQLNAAGTTILLTTHYLEEAEALCDRIGIIHEGQLVANDTTPNLLRRLDSKRVTVTADRPLPVVPEALAAAGWEFAGDRQLALTYRPSQTPIGEKLAMVQASGIAIIDLSTEEAD
ncbi:MAG: ABC transporter ATP-binding protein, partial [Pseudomonadota bacterium]|nr:ABC transporter ATP-binding protein [Pseudomonadota bacterium]